MVSRTIHSWAQGRALLERWQRSGANVRVELKPPRVIDVVPIDFLRGEPVERQGAVRRAFVGRLLCFTSADVTTRLLSGAVLIIDTYELAPLSDGRRRVEPR